MTITVKPVNISAITKALEEQIRNDSRVADHNPRVERSGPLNDTPANCPWIGIYRDSVQYTIRTLGFGQGARDQEIKLVVAVQESDGNSGDKCEERLEELLAHVVGALLTDVTIGGLVRELKDVTLLYADYRKDGSTYMQTAAIYLTAVVSVIITQD